MGSPGDSALAEVANTADLVAVMERRKRVSGLTFRQLEQRAEARGDVLPRSTLSEVLAGKRMPRRDLVLVFARAIGDEEHLEDWGGAWERATIGVAAEPSDSVEERNGARLSRKAVAAIAVVVAATAGLVIWLLTTSGEPEDVGMAPGSTPAASPSGWVRIRPVAAPELCLTDGRVLDQRYEPLVAVQRPCDQTAPQRTMLQPVGDELRLIQWHHPDFGVGCLKALTEGPGAGLLEPWDKCDLASRFRVEPASAAGQYVLRLDGLGCVGIEGAGSGAEAAVRPCTGQGGQLFMIDGL